MAPVTRPTLAVIPSLSRIPVHPRPVLKPPVKAGEILIVAIIVRTIPSIGANWAVVRRRSRRVTGHAACQHDAEAENQHHGLHGVADVPLRSPA